MLNDLNKKSAVALQVLHFSVQHIQMCMDIKFLEKVLPLTLIESLPHSPPYLIGLINVAGKSIPVMDLAIRLGLPHTETYSLETPILLCSHKSHQVGIIVDKVLGLADVKTADLQINDEFNQAASPFLAAVTTGDELSLLMNVERVLSISLTAEMPVQTLDGKFISTGGFKNE